MMWIYCSINMIAHKYWMKIIHSSICTKDGLLTIQRTQIQGPHSVSFQGVKEKESIIDLLYVGSVGMDLCKGQFHFHATVWSL